MNIFRLIKIKALKRKINKALLPQINDYSFEEEGLSFAAESSVYKIVSKISKYREFDGTVKSFNDYLNVIDNHNTRIANLNAKISNFSKEECLRNYAVDVAGYLLIFQDDFNAIQNFKKITNEQEQFIRKYILIETNAELIKKQYLCKKEIENSLSSIDEQRYIDGVIGSKLIKEIENFNTLTKKADEAFYAPIDICGIKELIKSHNNDFIEKNINDPIFEFEDGRSYDINQRKAILKDAKSLLVVAGAGCGKTFTICGKVEYLLKRENISPDQILLLSYSKDSAEDLKRKIYQIQPGLNVRTFHSLGYEIYSKYYKKKAPVENQLRAIVESFFREELGNYPKVAKMIFDLYTIFLPAPFEERKKYDNTGDYYASLKGSSADFHTLKHKLESLSKDTEKKITIKQEIVKSFEELAIANYLFLNGIEYEYEAPYKFDVSTNERRQYTPDFYLSEYGIYLEHYGVDRNMVPNHFSGEEAVKYVEGIQWKRQIHKEHLTKCIETYSYEFNEGTIFEKLEKKLGFLGIKTKPVSEEFVSNCINSVYEDREFASFISLICSFISLYKGQYPDANKFKELKLVSNNNKFLEKRQVLFLEICEEIYNFYKNKLENDKTVDFDDMILKSNEKIPLMDEYKYKYIIVDEFQDISISRLTFLKSLIKHGDAKLFAVGDDWQSIYRFSGCDINLFLRFKNEFDFAETQAVTTTFRNSQELLNISEPFILKNEKQIKKHVSSLKNLGDPIKVVYYDYNKAESLKTTLKYIYEKDSTADIMILSRNNKDFEKFTDDTFLKKHDGSVVYSEIPDLKICFKTVHKSKGLQAKYVILLNIEDSRMGFPNKVEDDPILNLVLSDKDDFDFAEERRLFYVALTRTETYCFLLVNANRPSMFFEEIKTKCHEINPQENTSYKERKKCPYCKTGDLVLRENSIDGSIFYACSNFPHCKYTMSDLQAVRDDKRCPKCGDFMVRKKGKYGTYYHCLNKHCNTNINVQNYENKK